jgi:hypothetical protein
MAVRTLLLKLETRGRITLPARRRSPTRRRAWQPVAEPALFSEAAKTVPTGLVDLLPVSIEEISYQKSPGKKAQFVRLLAQHHYLGHRGTVGENLQYLVSDRQGNVLACVLFGAAAWQCKARDATIGWDGATRARGLAYVTNNTRFLILPWVARASSGQPSARARHAAAFQRLAAQIRTPVPLAGNLRGSEPGLGSGLGSVQNGTKIRTVSDGFTQ